MSMAAPVFQPPVAGSKTRPAMSSSARPAWRRGPASSDGFMNFFQSCVPGGTQPSTYSAPNFAKTSAFIVRLIVDRISNPPGLTRCASAPRNSAGASTCSTISSASTTSKRARPSSASASTLLKR